MGVRARGDGGRRLPRQRKPQDQQGPRDHQAQEESGEARTRERDTKKFPGLLEPRPCARLGFLKRHRDGSAPSGRRASSRGSRNRVIANTRAGASRMRRQGEKPWRGSSKRSSSRIARDAAIGASTGNRGRRAYSPARSARRASCGGSASSPRASRESRGPKGGRGGRPQARHRGAGVCRRPKEQASGGRHHARPDQGGTALPRCRHGRVLQEGGRLVDAGPHHREDHDRRDRASHRTRGPQTTEASSSMTTKASSTHRRRSSAASARTEPRDRYRGRERRSTTPWQNRSSRRSKGSW